MVTNRFSQSVARASLIQQDPLHRIAGSAAVSLQVSQEPRYIIRNDNNQQRDRPLGSFLSVLPL